MTIATMFPELKAEPTVPRTVRLLLQAVPVPASNADDKGVIAAAVRRRLFEMLDLDSPQYADDAALAKLVTTDDRDITSQVRDGDIATAKEGIRKYVRDVLAKLPEDERIDVLGLSFDTVRHDNGYFLNDTPSLIERDGTEYDWYEVFKDGGLDNFTGTLTAALDENPHAESQLVLSLDTLDEYETVEDLLGCEAEGNAD